MFWRFDALLGLFLKTVQHIDSIVDLHRVHSPIGVAQVILDHFEDASPAKTPQRLGIRVLLACLSEMWVFRPIVTVDSGGS